MELSSSNSLQEKDFLIFRETKTPKKFLAFSQKKAFLIFPEMETLKKFLYLRKYLSELEKTNKQTHKNTLKMFLIFQGNVTFLPQV